VVVFSVLVGCSGPRPAKVQRAKTYISKSGIRFVFIPRSSFAMGVEGDKEQPRRMVQISPFWISETELTFAQCRAALASAFPDKRKIEASGLPVSGLCFTSAMKLVRQLVKTDGLPYVIPTEAQWECAARGGLDSAEYPWGNFRSAKQLSCVDSHGPCLVRSYPANNYGVFDVTGNVWEYVRESDYDASGKDVKDPIGPLTGKMRLMRGGSYMEVYCPVSNRSPVPDGDDALCFDVGLRLALEDDQKYHNEAQ